MSNQFPPAGQGEGFPNSGNQPNNSGYDAGQGNAGYQSSTGDYQGYQPQSNYQGYGSGDGNYQAQNDYSSYGSYGQSQPDASGSYGQQGGATGYGQDSYNEQAQVYGQQDAANAYSQGTNSAYGQDSSAAYGQEAQHAYGQDAYAQQPAYAQQSAYGQPQQDPNAAAYGGYNQQGYTPAGQQPKKKGPAGWVWALVAVLGIALIGGAVWGGIALFGGGGGLGGGPDYSIESKEVPSDVEVSYNGEWKESSYSLGSSLGSKTYQSSDGNCLYVAAYASDGIATVDPDNVRGSMKDALDESLKQSTGPNVDLNAEERDPIKKKDTEGIEVEFLTYQVDVKSNSSYGGGSDQGSIYVAVHPFSDSGSALTAMMICQGSVNESDFREQFDATEFTITEGDSKD